MNTLLSFSLLILGFVAILEGAKPADKIKNLPEWKGTFDQYAGYININSGKRMFYWFVESQGNPSTDPLVLWLNGGPGCSSLGGLMTENGPFRLDEKGVLNPNPYSWNTAANMLYLESPAQVGFSYWPGYDGQVFTDNITAEDNYQFLSGWFKEFPEYNNTDFYITGESYAGHYVPTLVYRIYQGNEMKNFKGYMIGNPSTTDHDQDTLKEYLKTHAMIPLKGSEAGQGNYDPYDILVDVCERDHLREYVRFPHPLVDALKDEAHPKRYVPPIKPCLSQWVAKYMNRKDVQAAIHAHPTHWTGCGGPKYKFGEESMIPYHTTFMDHTNYKIGVYSGTADSVVNFIGTEEWVLGLNRKVVTKWSPWQYERHNAPNGAQLAGFEIEFDRITYTTVKGAGHMVPWFQPAPALTMFKKFIGK